MNLNLLLCAAVLIVCVASSKLSNKIGVPTLVLFIVLGMLFGTDGIFGIGFDDYQLAEQLCSTALIVIMFYGGFGTNWSPAKPVAVKAVLLSSLGVVATAVLTGLFCHFVLGMELLEGLLVGSVIGSTDAASVFSILRSKKLNLKHGLASLLEVESGSNDPFAYTMTMVILTLMAGKGEADIASFVFSQLVFGAVCGAVVGCLSAFLLRRIHFEINGLHTILVVAVALLSFAVPSLLGGNGYLSVYITGIILGNSRIFDKVTLVHFFDGLTWMMQILIFFSLGLLAFPSQIPQIILPALAITLFLTFVARPAAVFAILTWFKTPVKQQLLVSWAGFRGAASIVFAIYAVLSDASTNFDIFHIVFCVALLSVTFQGTLLPLFAKKLGLVDDSDTVLQTFSDYQDPHSMMLVAMPVSAGHPWIGCKLSEISLPDGSLVVLIRRADTSIVPDGDTMILSGDELVVSCSAYEDDGGVQLREETVDKRHPWLGKTLQEIFTPAGSLVVMIRRENESLIPKGDTRIKPNDVLVMSVAPTGSMKSIEEDLKVEGLEKLEQAPEDDAD